MRITVFLRFFLSHSTEKFREEPSNVSKSFKCEVSKKILNKNGISRFSFENFLSQSAKKIRWGTLRYIRKVRLSKNFMPKTVISLFSVEFMSRLLPIKLAREPLCDPGFLGHRKLLCSIGWYRDSPLIFLASQYWKISWLTPCRNFRVSKLSMPENGKSRSSVENFCLTVREKFLGTTSKLQNTWDLGNSHAYHGFPSIFFCLTVPKNFVRNHLKFKKVSKVRYRKKIWMRTGYHDFPSKIFWLRVPKDFVVEHFVMSEKFGYREISCLRGWYHFSPLNFFHVYCL